MAKTAPDDPCPCGSGFSYADCHLAINEAPPDQVLNVALKQYADRWSVNAKFYDSQGIYATLAKHLSYHITPSRILDIGCGRGQGLKALIDQFGLENLEIVAVDENPECLAATANLLSIPAPNIRIKKLDVGNNKYDIAFTPGLITSSQKVTLINTDISRPDDELDKIVTQNGKIDAVTIWFSGTHGARHLDIENERQQLNSSTAIRMATEIAAAEVAVHFGRKGGVLHVVNRAVERSESICHSIVKVGMEELARFSNISLRNLTLYPYSEPASQGRVSVGRAGEDTSGMKHFVTSAIFQI